jgi:hypothetical protein
MSVRPPEAPGAPRRLLVRAAIALVVAVVVVVLSASTASAAPAGVQADCGYVTCTARLDRDSTKALEDYDKVTGVASSLCGALVGAGVAAGVLCAAAVNGAGTAISLLAREVYDDGDCLGLRLVIPTVVPLPPPAPVALPVVYPVRVAAGTFTCR